MTRTVIDLDDAVVADAMRLYGTRTKAEAVRAAMTDAVKLRLRRQFADLAKAGALDPDGNPDDSPDTR
ncbi:MAG TPA: type II toxin-antitoxin system VapB family antitoxin [Actinocatenispora sp.]